MSLPHYTKLPTSEESKLAPAPESLDFSSSAPTAQTSTSTTSSGYVLPSQFCSFELVGCPQRWATATGVAHRGLTKEETIRNVAELFPDAHIDERDQDKISFSVPSGPGYTKVADRYWDELVAHGKPDRMQISIKLTKKEARSDTFKVLSIVLGPFLALFLVFVVLIAVVG